MLSLKVCLLLQALFYVALAASPTPLPSAYVSLGQSPPASLEIDFTFDSKKALSPKDELATEISVFMNIPVEQVVVVRYSLYTATVVICSGDIESFVNSVNRENDLFVGTLLEGATIPLNVIYNVPCAENDLPDPPAASDTNSIPPSQSSDYGRSQVKSNFAFSPAASTIYIINNVAKLSPNFLLIVPLICVLALIY